LQGIFENFRPHFPFFPEIFKANLATVPVCRPEETAAAKNFNIADL